MIAIDSIGQRADQRTPGPRFMGGQRPTASWWSMPEAYGGKADAVRVSGVVTGTDNTSAINQCLLNTGLCVLSSTSQYGIKGYVRIGSNETFCALGPSATLIKLDDLEIDQTHPTPLNGLSDWGPTFHTDLMVRSRDNFTSNPSVLNIEFDCNGGAAHRKVINAGSLTNDGTYTPGSQAIFLVGNGQRVIGNTFKNMCVCAGTVSRTYNDYLLGTITADRLPSVPETFVVFLGILTDLWTWTAGYSATYGRTDYEFQAGPTVTDNTFLGPLIPQTGDHEFPIRETAYASRAEITLLTISGYVRTADNGQHTDTGHYYSDLWYPRQMYRGVTVHRNQFRDLNIWRNAADVTDKQLAPIHCITAGGVKDLSVRDNVIDNVDGPLFYIDNSIILGGEIAFNTSENGCAQGILLSMSSYSTGRGFNNETGSNRYGSGAWIRNVRIHDNDLPITGLTRLASVCVDYENTIAATANMPRANVMQSTIGSTGLIFPLEWGPGGPWDVYGLGPFVDTSGNCAAAVLMPGTTPVDYHGSDLYPATATHMAQTAIFENVSWYNNNFIAYGAGPADASQYPAALLHFSSSAYVPSFAACRLNDNVLGSLNWSDDYGAWLAGPSRLLTCYNPYNNPFVSMSGNRAANSGELLQLQTSYSWLNRFQADDEFYGAWPLGATKSISMSTLSAFGVAVTADSGFVYLAASYRACGTDPVSRHSIPVHRGTRYVWTDGAMNLVLPMPDSRMADGLWYDGSCPLGTVWEIINSGSAAITIFSANSTDATAASTNGDINLSGVIYTSGITIAAGSSRSFYADLNAHYLVVG